MAEPPNLDPLAMWRDMLGQWEREYPGRIESIHSAMRAIAPSQLADRELFDFAGLEQLRAAASAGSGE